MFSFLTLICKRLSIQVCECQNLRKRRHRIIASARRLRDTTGFRCYFTLVQPQNHCSFLLSPTYRCSPASALACQIAALEHSLSPGSCRRSPHQHHPLDQTPKTGVLSPNRSQSLKREPSPKKILMRTGALSVRTEENCSAATSVPKFFIWPVTFPLWMNPPGERCLFGIMHRHTWINKRWTGCMRRSAFHP